MLFQVKGGVGSVPQGGHWQGFASSKTTFPVRNGFGGCSEGVRAEHL
jgi:hypothetical protein